MSEPIGYSRSAPDPKGLIAPERDPITGHLRAGRRSDKDRSEPDQARSPRRLPRSRVWVAAAAGAAVVVVIAAVALAGGGDEQDVSTGQPGADGGAAATDSGGSGVPFELQPTDVVVLEDTTYDQFEQAYVDVGLPGQPSELARARCDGDTCVLVGTALPDGVEFVIGEPVNEAFEVDLYDDECPPFLADITVLATPTASGEYEVEYRSIPQQDELACGNGVSLLGRRLHATYRWVPFEDPAARAGLGEE